MAKDTRYKVVIGASVTEEGGKGFFDVGLVYTDMPYDKMVAVEGVLTQHQAAVSAALQPIMESLLELGVQEVMNRMQENDNPGVMR